MPIYEYRCTGCGFQDEYLQKLSEPPKTVCPSCGEETFRKLLSAAGFQLKGSGWYVTDFRNKSSGSSAKSDKGDSSGDTGAASGDAKSGEARSGEPKSGEGGGSSGNLGGSKSTGTAGATA